MAIPGELWTAIDLFTEASQRALECNSKVLEATRARAETIGALQQAEAERVKQQTRLINLLGSVTVEEAARIYCDMVKKHASRKSPVTIFLAHTFRDSAIFWRIVANYFIVENIAS